MHDSVMDYGRKMLTPELCHDNMVLEVGSHDVNGSLRDHIMQYEPTGYIGIDMIGGPGVDIRCTVEDAYDNLLRPESFGLVVCTEMLEHAEGWRSAVAAMVDLLQVGGTILLTTRSDGFPYHGYPEDFWRFSTAQMTAIAEACGLDYEITSDPDPHSPGVFLYGRRHTWISYISMFSLLATITCSSVVKP